MTSQPNASAAHRQETCRFLVALVVAEGIGAIALGAGWYQSRTSAALEQEAASTRLSAIEHQLSEKNTDLERCKDWMNARLVLAQGLDAPATSTAQVVPSAPAASAVPASAAAPADSRSANPVGQPDDDTKALEKPHGQRAHRVRQVHGQSPFEPVAGEGTATPNL